MLLLLVLISLGLSSVVWMGSSFPLIRPERAQGLSAPGNHRETDWRELLVPRSATVHLSSRDHFLLRCNDPQLAHLWSGGSLIEVLSALKAGAQQDVKPEAVQFDSPGVTIEFAMPWQYGGMEVESLTIAGGKNPNAILKMAEEPGRWVRFPLKSLPVPVDTLLREFDPKTAARAVELPTSYGQAALEKGIFVPVEDVEFIHYAGDYDLQGNEALATFFMDSAMLRRVMERDGAVIFTDGQRGLRLYPSGEIEFTWPQGEETQASLDRQKALEEAGKFVSQHGGFPVESRVKSVREAGEGYHVEIDYFVDGYPVLRRGGSAIQLDVDRSGVKRYFRGVRKASRVVDTLQDELSWKDALAIAVRSQAPDGKAVTVVRRIYRCYIDEGSLRPAWAVETYRGIIVVDSVSGQVTLL